MPECKLCVAAQSCVRTRAHARAAEAVRRCDAAESRDVELKRELHNQRNEVAVVLEALNAARAQAEAKERARGDKDLTAQRVQEDTIKFSRIMESLGTSLIEALMILVEFMPILFGLSIGIPIFFFGDWDYGLIVGALIWSVGGTIFLIFLGLILRLVGVEYDLQKKEAAYRKILVIAEDDGTIRPKTIEELFDGVRSIHFLSYIRYLYFNIGRIAYLQANVLSAYVFLAPAIVAGAVTLGVMQQIIRAFGRVEGSMQYILKAWPTIIELASVYKRLREFEYKIKKEEFVDEKI